MTVPQKAHVRKESTIYTYSHLWHASRSTLEAGIANEAGSSWQFLSSIVLTAFAFEAYLNHVGAQLIADWEKKERSLSAHRRFQEICAVLQVSLPNGPDQRPLSTLRTLQNFRNTLAHGKTQTLRLEPTVCDAELADSRLQEVLLTDWQQHTEDERFAETARKDVEDILRVLQDARPEPKEPLFLLGDGRGSATLLTPHGT